MIPADRSHDRAMLLYEQRRYSDAERELRSGLSQQPEDGRLHAWLALTLAQQEKFADASAEADQAVGLQPDLPFAHYVQGLVLFMRNRANEAEGPAVQAVALDPYNPQFHWLLGAVKFEQRRWPGALDEADLGLSVDPEHAGCVNLRAMALVKLGRKDEAGAAIDEALSKDPDNAHTHANRGWTLLHQGDHRRSLEHFREALRLDPNLDWARAGMVEALKARNPFYRGVLRYFLWMSNLSPTTRWVIVLGGYFGFRSLASASHANPALRPYVLPIVIAYVLFFLATWLSDPLFNLLLRFSRYGRYLLNRKQTWATNVLALLLGAAAATVVVQLFVPYEGLLGLGLVLAALTIPATSCFRLAAGWPTLVMTGATAVLAALGFVAIGLLMSAYNREIPSPEALAAAQSTADLGETFVQLFAYGFLGSQFLYMSLAGATPKR